MIRFQAHALEFYLEFKHRRRNGQVLTICKLVQPGKVRNKVWGSGTSEGLVDAPRHERLKIAYLRAVGKLSREIRKPAGDAFFNRHDPLPITEETETSLVNGRSLGAVLAAEISTAA